jgi:hypothetical protein
VGGKLQQQQHELAAAVAEVAAMFTTWARHKPAKPLYVIVLLTYRLAKTYGDPCFAGSGVICACSGFNLIKALHISSRK